MTIITMRSLLLMTLLLVVGCTYGAEQYRVHSVPSLVPSEVPPFPTYSGLLPVPGTQRHLFFMLTMASDIDPNVAPSVLWLTGGPGCSSMIAALTENGPFRPVKNGSLVLNSWSWNRRANMIWLESPAGVGFSYSNDPQDYKEVNDTRTASDSFQILLQLFDLFPQFKKNPFWVTGESYGGHYVPELTDLCANDPQKRIPIAGMQVGNAWTYMPIDNSGALQTWVDRALVPKELTDDVRKVCNLSDVGPLLRGQQHVRSYLPTWEPKAESSGCQDAIGKAMSVAFNDVNIYDIYVDECNESFQGRRLPIATMSRYRKATETPPVNPCVSGYLSHYLNRADVQKALNVPQHISWSECSGVVEYSYESIKQSVIPVYEDLINNHPHVHILVYSGDVDAIVPYAGSRAWTKGMNLSIVDAWRAWHVSDSYGVQAGGFVEVFKGLTFATVRNAGHEVPFYQPKRAYYMFNYFLSNQTLPA